MKIIAGISMPSLINKLLSGQGAAGTWLSVRSTTVVVVAAVVTGNNMHPNNNLPHFAALVFS